MGERAHTRGRERPILFSAPMVRALLDGRKTQTRRIVKDVPPQPAPNCHPSNTPRHPAPYLDSYCGQPKTAANPRGMSTEWMWWQVDDRCGYPSFMVKFAPSDRLWVREAWARSDEHDWLVAYRADGECGAWQWDGDGKPLFNRHGKVLACSRRDGLGEWGLGRFGNRWRSSIHLPRKYSRLTLTVTNVRVQRLHEISEEDARAEGITDGGCLNCGFPEPCGCAYPHPDARDSFSHLWQSINGAGSWEANPWVAAYTFTVDRRNIDANPTPDRGVTAPVTLSTDGGAA